MFITVLQKKSVNNFKMYVNMELNSFHLQNFPKLLIC